MTHAPDCKRLLRRLTHYRTLLGQTLDLQDLAGAAQSSPDLVRSIHEHRAAIAQIKAALRERGMPVDDAPDDAVPPPFNQQAIAAALHAALPTHLQPEAAQLARLLTETLQAAPATQLPITESGLTPLIAALAGRQLTADRTVLTFGSESQLGDVAIRDVVAGHSINLTVNMATGHAMRYHQADALLDHLCPLSHDRPRSPRIYENLPAPTYSQFVMREQAFAEVIDGLQQRSAAVLIVGMGGNGKTSLAREVAAQCLRDSEGQAPRFDAVVWVSDKDQPGTTNLSMVLDEIARTLDYPGLSEFMHDEKQREVEQLLRRQRVLLVVDNFETISDGALLAWLLRLPEPSKALITSREYRREFHRSGWPVELRGMSQDEAQTFITERLRVLKLEKLVTLPSQIEPLVAATGGSPYAIAMAIGIVKYGRLLSQIVEDIYEARSKLFEELFARAWSLLDEAARHVLLGATFFPTSTSSQALSAAADMHGLSFEQTIERLTDLALLDVQQVDLSNPPRYALHPLVRSFACAKLSEHVKFELEARDRWIAWYTNLVTQVGWSWNNLSRLNLLDGESESAYAVIEWAAEHQRYQITIRLAHGMRYYFFIRGQWAKRQSVSILQLAAARQLADQAEEVLALAHCVQILSRQDQITEAEAYMHQLEVLAPTVTLSTRIFTAVQHAFGLYWMAKGDLDRAQAAWQRTLDRAEQLAPNTYVAQARRVAVCLYQRGQLQEAVQLLQEAHRVAQLHDYMHGILSTQLELATIYLDLERIEEAEALVINNQAHADQYQMRTEVALTQQLAAHIHILRGNISAARAALIEAIDLFERLGMHRELIKARAEMAGMETTVEPAPEPE
jgi:tetratricopeptide (TPR) repeat protein